MGVNMMLKSCTREILYLNANQSLEKFAKEQMVSPNPSSTIVQLALVWGAIKRADELETILGAVTWFKSFEAAAVEAE